MSRNHFKQFEFIYLLFECFERVILVNKKIIFILKWILWGKVVVKIFTYFIFSSEGNRWYNFYNIFFSFYFLFSLLTLNFWKKIICFCSKKNWFSSKNLWCFLFVSFIRGSRLRVKCIKWKIRRKCRTYFIVQVEDLILFLHNSYNKNFNAY